MKNVLKVFDLEPENVRKSDCHFSKVDFALEECEDLS